MRSAILVLLVLPAALYAQDFATMPASLQARWQCSLTARPGWTGRDYATWCWQPVTTVPGRFPLWMEPEDQALHSFMWHPDGAHTGQPVYFRRCVWLPGRIEQAIVHVCVDDRADLYVNGQGLGRALAAHEDAHFSATEELATGENVLAVQAQDTAPPGYGLLVVPEITQRWPMDDGGWQCSLNGWRWQQAMADTAPIKLEGLPPFACVSVPGGMKEFSTACFRRTLAIDGVPLQADAVILADDSYELRVNGTLVTLEKRLEKAYFPRKVNLAPYLHPGQNELTVKVTNDWGPGRMYCVPTVTMSF